MIGITGFAFFLLGYGIGMTIINWFLRGKVNYWRTRTIETEERIRNNAAIHKVERNDLKLEWDKIDTKYAVAQRKLQQIKTIIESEYHL